MINRKSCHKGKTSVLFAFDSIPDTPPIPKHCSQATGERNSKSVDTVSRLFGHASTVSGVAREVEPGATREILPGVSITPRITETAAGKVEFDLTGAALATAAVAGVGAWVLLSGILHGGYAHVYKDALFLLDGPPGLYYPLNPDEHYPPNDLFFEVTGALETVSAFFVALYTYRLLRDRRAGAGAE